MSYSYENGKIVVKDKYFSDTVYHVSNERISVVFGGKGAIFGYALANEEDMLDGSISLFFNNAPIDIYSEKTVEMVGRCQTVTVHLDGADFRIVQFLDASVNGVFSSYELVSEDSDDSVTVTLGVNQRLLMNATPVGNNEVMSDGFSFGANTEVSFISLNDAIYFTVPSGKRVCTFISMGSSFQCATPFVSDFDRYERKMRDEIASVHIPKALSEEQKALFLSAYFCSLENYKCLGDYKGFMAGHHYLLPMRTYYRDSYYTVLPMYRAKSELVKMQIMTLAMGINENGDCPSAVKSDYSNWWGNHYDSPSFFAMMIYDYVKYTGDSLLLSKTVKGESVLRKAENAINKLSEFADESFLIYKEGPYNQRDWADEVNRNGYVTYNEILYARALFSLSKLFEISGNRARADDYMHRFEKVKNAINEILWDDELGYYVNFKERDYTEKNLSVDTCLAALFGIADGERAHRMLENMEKLLETRNNKEQKAGDYGVMCVYPFYSRVGEARNKSAQPYYYHNGGNWPYLSAMYAAAKRKHGMEYRYALESWFDYNVRCGNYTPVEFFAPPHKCGSLLQAWSGAAAFVMDEEISKDFWD